MAPTRPQLTPPPSPLLSNSTTPSLYLTVYIVYSNFLSICRDLEWLDNTSVIAIGKTQYTPGKQSENDIKSRFIANIHSI